MSSLPSKNRNLVVAAKTYTETDIKVFLVLSNFVFLDYIYYCTIWHSVKAKDSSNLWKLSVIFVNSSILDFLQDSETSSVDDTIEATFKAPFNFYWKGRVFMLNNLVSIL